MGLTFAEAKACGLEHLWPKESKAMPIQRLAVSAAPDDGMNKTERRLSLGLDSMQDRHLIKEWAFEPEKFRMADKTWYRPDFRVTLLAGLNIFAEVKVLKKDGSILWTDDGAVKVKTIAEMHPYPIFLALWGDNRWSFRRLPSRRWGWIAADIEWSV